MGSHALSQSSDSALQDPVEADVFADATADLLLVAAKAVDKPDPIIESLDNLYESNATYLR